MKVTERTVAEKTARRKEKLRIGTTACVIVGALLVFFSQTSIRFANPAMLLAGGLVFTAGFVGCYAALELEWSSNRAWTSFAIAVAGFWIVFQCFSAANDAAIENDKRCLAIQRDMLSAEPRRDDGPDLFQALGCRPQGEGSVYAPPAKK